VTRIGELLWNSTLMLPLSFSISSQRASVATYR
jgi:hypothetical protein